MQVNRNFAKMADWPKRLAIDFPTAQAECPLTLFAPAGAQINTWINDRFSKSLRLLDGSRVCVPMEIVMALGAWILSMSLPEISAWRTTKYLLGCARLVM
jgi:hypothetical protein